METLFFPYNITICKIISLLPIFTYYRDLANLYHTYKIFLFDYYNFHFVEYKISRK
ncbi:hypothetical protein HMPREF9996_00085 [Aggregatibacter actinomycetemcomitans Y4]|nr:hypothetical protein HMPREF9996_00085 [Aggregatibacter actinomycetemcomitans Y4]